MRNGKELLHEVYEAAKTSKNINVLDYFVELPTWDQVGIGLLNGYFKVTIAQSLFWITESLNNRLSRISGEQLVLALLQLQKISQCLSRSV